MKYNDDGTYKDIYVKSYDTLPIGAEFDYNGETVPSGYVQVADYSTNEIDTGKVWIDGKKIYRKVISNTIGTTNGAWKSIQAFDANYIDTIISMSGTFVYNTASKACYTFPFLRATDNSFANREYVLNNCNIATGVVSVIAYHPTDYSFMSGQPIILIIEYTKA